MHRLHSWQVNDVYQGGNHNHGCGLLVVDTLKLEGNKCHVATVSDDQYSAQKYDPVGLGFLLILVSPTR